MATVKKAIAKNSTSKKAVAKRKHATSSKPNYLTKRILTKAAKKGFASAAIATMEIMGFNVIVHRGWVVKKFADGHIERIKKLQTTNTSTPIALD